MVRTGSAGKTRAAATTMPTSTTSSGQSSTPPITSCPTRLPPSCRVSSRRIGAVHGASSGGPWPSCLLFAFFLLHVAWLIPVVEDGRFGGRESQSRHVGLERLEDCLE